MSEVEEKEKKVEEESEELKVKIELETSELQNFLKTLTEELKSLRKEKEETKTAVAQESVGPSEEFEAWLKRANEAVSGIPSTFTYTRDLLVISDKIGVGLRDYADVVQVGRGEREARWYKINVPPFGPLTSKTAPAEVSHTITTVTGTVVERGAHQVIGYEELEQSVVDLVRGIERTFEIAAQYDMDKLILDELDTNTYAHYAGGASGESGVSSSDILTLNELLAAKRKLIDNAKRVPRPGELVLVCSTKQYHDLLRDSGVMKAADFGGSEPVRRGELPQVLGINIIQTDQVSTGTGAGDATVYRAHLFFPKAFGLAISRDLMIEAFREPPKRAISLTASYVAGAKLIEPKYALKVVTA